MGKNFYKVVKKPRTKMVKDNTNCFWCDVFLAKREVTKDHVIPKGMGGKDSGRVVPCCTSCNQERGRVTELYNQRLWLIKNVKKKPQRTNEYKNTFRSKVRGLGDKIIKWEILHRRKNVILPFSLLEIIKLDEMVPL